MVSGGLLILCAPLLLAAALLFASGRHYDGPTIGSALLHWSANGTFALGIALLVAGIIVRAIWFLPGDDAKAPPKP